MRQRREATATRGAVRRRAGRAGRALPAAAVVLALVGGAIAASPAIGQEADGGEVRVVARKLSGGKVEVGLQQRQADDSWSDRHLPSARLLPTSAPIGGWLASSPLTLPVGEVRIAARRLAGGRVEFGLQQRRADDSWGDRLLPRARFLPADARTDGWLASSPVSLTFLPDSQPVPPHETAARALLAGEVGADPQEFRLESSERVHWSDTSLGCPEPGYFYAAVVVPGYRLVFTLDGTSYQLHTNDDGSQAVVCNTGR